MHIYIYIYIFTSRAVTPILLLSSESRTACVQTCLVLFTANGLQVRSIGHFCVHYRKQTGQNQGSKDIFYCCA